MSCWSPELEAGHHVDEACPSNFQIGRCTASRSPEHVLVLPQAALDRAGLESTTNVRVVDVQKVLHEATIPDKKEVENASRQRRFKPIARQQDRRVDVRHL
eukprot:CAMPEP_0198657668 /NCGR_PEP_ID=MMETSP1467-20131203/18461_1 /TAXON_ID=1462469 /ORGANISM="unid. sp., Strain CCMP2135" /LENGTH=100 /DNA_ID=CAMNT_0044393877 /DNA_START=295 /DNA_END=598 /DNA_ORIENTATION=-